MFFKNFGSFNGSVFQFICTTIRKKFIGKNWRSKNSKFFLSKIRETIFLALPGASFSHLTLAIFFVPLNFWEDRYHYHPPALLGWENRHMHAMAQFVKISILRPKIHIRHISKKNQRQRPRPVVHNFFLKIPQQLKN